ncbi:NAD(P)H-dependent oxidoreductase [Vibrio chagasii]|jgi:putative NADPH-quinone reductase|uniref:Flavodoxin family protein n=1 Tax=Vibrio chagasii TaxID=170679 RepID=A0A7Y4DSF4_9VIBR|nr:NAD(P)H-dependent oxidoreductase [Vibrio chagasii]NOH34690.1 flavodoxin family protein [Vibrio chagasii]CAH7222023.1 glutathione-regulated potassium-efflux system ancillary protein KefG [Vibrio chagasii]CAH7287258.1 glutathione-regulated potassium-efflux system ancillary protein KefG [Vibrio chagasii]CAH7324254.1 glutathione-regulated potassium-efflux system ancillary protein KefG [Vibrio chagasii]
MSKNRVLVLFAHPSQHRSEANKPLFEQAKRIDGVTCVDLYAEYPTFKINIDREQKRLLDHDIIIFQFPLYWYSTPAILKEWQDLVLEYGFAYGTDGNELEGKKFLCSITAGGKEDAYQTDGYNHFTIRELLHPLEQTAALCGMEYLAPYALFGSRTALEESRITGHVERYKFLLESLVAGNIDYKKAKKAAKLNHYLDEIINKD